MNRKSCLYCYQPLSGEDLASQAGKAGFHPSCSKKFFGKTSPPELPFTENDILKLAEQVIKSHKAVTGVQPKLSLSIENVKNSQVPERFTIVGLWGEYILKPQTEAFKHLPENEDLTMHLATLCGINTVEHSLISLKSGQLAYITKRIDRKKVSGKSVAARKLHMEDMCQLTERLTEHKYKGSYEQIAKTLLRYSANPGLDVINFYEQVIFCFLTGNNDMHLKNFSLLKADRVNYNLCPAYDLVASALVLPEDDEELALTLNGKKKKLKKTDFDTAMLSAGIEQKAMDNIYRRFSNSLARWEDFIDISFLPEDMKVNFQELINSRFDTLGL
ncbi:HipA domain-containing protein [uncultured Imperialibacter sp.]|uniref:HipA domain-containing protein n=1 Tax=uncultured Imperialibacter sp. TaxID=1672639 RepID=UPI0030D8841B|tara:strand:- start:10677 stop:11669 length:993 start_codon:yes stop_codon:yes gene_type:complete